ncbi:MAG: DUF1015 domain-containing protein [Pirellulaceae bacterium]|nr:DUF1015 domain-containing protein [Pirellulaceae bacterium]
MPKIQAFPGLRYDLGHVGSLSDVIAPPYDVIDDQLRDSLYEKHPANVIRLILNREEPGDDEQSNCYSRAARFLKNWRSEGVLEREADPAIYVYHQSFEVDGQPLTRRGFMCRTQLEKFGEGSIYPHEETHASAKEDRLKLTRACHANLSQIFGLFPDPEGEAQNLLEAHITNQQPIEATDHLGVVHRIWPVTDANVIAQVSALMNAKPVFIADGHHRYETACNFREELREQQGIDEKHPANCVLMMCVGMNDPGMIVLPTHRLFREMPALTSSELIEKLGDRFDCQVAGESPEQAESIWSEIENENEQGTIGLFTAKDQKWVIARITPAGRERMKEIASDQSSDWQGLGVSILHRMIVEDQLGQTKLPKPKYVHLVSELQDGLAKPDEFSLAALVMPATLDHIRAISQHGERMPAKSTYFYPKLLSGLVINPLD